MTEKSDATPAEGPAPSWWDKTKALFKRAKESEAADKAGDVAGKAWDKTKDVAGKTWDKTKDVAGDVKDKVDEKREERRADGGASEEKSGADES